MLHHENVLFLMYILKMQLELAISGAKFLLHALFYSIVDL